MSASGIRLFQAAAYGWLALYMIALLVLGDAAWTNAPVDLFTAGAGPMGTLQWSINSLTGRNCVVLCAIVLMICIALLRRHRWWLGLIVWSLFRVIAHRTWLASNGGVQLMENMLLWAAFMVVPSNAPPRSTFVLFHLSTFSFWAARLQLLLAYAAAAAHKFTGTTWLDGTAVQRVAHDPLFHLGSLTDHPMLCALLTYLTLAWMTLFPLAVWWKWSRRTVLIIGVLFHLSTALFMDIPQMGLAFIVCYAVWLSGPGADGIMQWSRRVAIVNRAPA